MPKLLEFLRSQPSAYVGQEDQCRTFLEAVLWIVNTGGAWRKLPAEYGNWNTVYKRFTRWSESGVWDRMRQHFADDPDMADIIIDHTRVRTRSPAAEAEK